LTCSPGSETKRHDLRPFRLVRGPGMSFSNRLLPVLPRAGAAHAVQDRYEVGYDGLLAWSARSPEHLERFYKRMRDNGSSPGTAGAAPPHVGVNCNPHATKPPPDPGWGLRSGWSAGAEDTRSELVRGCPQHAFQLFGWGFGASRTSPDLRRSVRGGPVRTGTDRGECNQEDNGSGAGPRVPRRLEQRRHLGRKAGWPGSWLSWGHCHAKRTPFARPCAPEAVYELD
jgi:hypothetical protein